MAEQKQTTSQKVNINDSSNGNISLKLDIFEAIQQLSESERLCTTLALTEGYSTKEISRITSLT